MVEILGAVLGDGIEAVEAVCAEALAEGVHSVDVILNILSRRREPEPPAMIVTPGASRRKACLRHGASPRSRSPTAPGTTASGGPPMMDRTEILATMGALKLVAPQARLRRDGQTSNASTSPSGWSATCSRPS